jgi:hydrogenase maturation protease
VADRPDIAVIGMGNLLMRDDGVGVHALQELEKGESLPEGVVTVDGGTDPWGSLAATESCRRLVLLDAVKGPAEPGSIYRVPVGKLKKKEGKSSLHEIDLTHLLELKRVTGEPCDSAVVIGMEPESIEPGTELSEPCRRALPGMLEAVRKEIQHLTKRKANKGAAHAGN